MSTDFWGNQNWESVIRCAKGTFAEGFWKVQGFPFSSGKAPQNSPVTQVSASLLAGGLYSADALSLVKGEFRGAFPPEKGTPCTFQNPPSENLLRATRQSDAVLCCWPKSSSQRTSHVPQIRDVWPHSLESGIRLRSQMPNVN